MTVAFTYRSRRPPGAVATARVGGLVAMDERVEYVLSFPNGCDQEVAQRLRTLGGDLLGSNTGVLGFSNFVGRTDLAGAHIEVVSTKLGSDGVSRVLQEVSQLAAGLVFGSRTPTAFSAQTTTTLEPPVPYHQLQFLRDAILLAPPGQRLQDWLGAIERNPTRRFEPERPVVRPNQVRRLDNRALRSIFTRVDRLVPVPAQSTLANTLTDALNFGAPLQAHFPGKVAAPRSRLSFDTPENRFVKHALRECQSLVYRFLEHPQLHFSMRTDCRQMLGFLDQAARAQVFTEAGLLSTYQAPSQALTKAEGYREVFAFWNEMSRHASLPLSAEETMHLLEGRNIATLYEYWVFLKTLEAATVVTGTKPTGPPTIRRDDLGETLSVGLRTNLGDIVTLRFNPTFTRSTNTSYSTPLRPDVVLECGETRHAFDAKYRLEYFDSYEGDVDDGGATYKRADLYKMHTYRDAISGLKSAFVVYPGTEFVFFERAGRRHSHPKSITLVDGVGAVPLRPALEDPAVDLRAVLQAILNS